MSGFLGGGIGPTAIKRRSGLAAPVPVAGSSIMADGNMEAAGVTSWSAAGSPSVREKSTAQKVSGAQSLLLLAGNAGSGAQQILSPTSGAWYQLTGSIYLNSGVAKIDATFAAFAISSTSNSVGAWVALVCTVRATNLRFFSTAVGGAAEWYLDDASAVPLALASLLSTRAYASADCDLSAAVTRTAGTQAGLCARLDSASTPANFIIAYLDGAGNVKMDKCVAGTYTNIITGAVDYAAGRVLRLVCSGNNVSAYYNGVQVGSTVTVSDAGIVSNVRHGLFSTYAANTFAGYTAA